MAGAKKKNKCLVCGDDLTEQNSFYAETESGLSPYCTKCQQSYFERLQGTNGTHLALYFCCIKYDVPCNPLLLPENVNSEDFLQSDDAKDGVWIYYLRQIEQTKLYEEGAETPNFFDGVTNILRIFGKNFTERDFAKFVQYEQEMIDSLEGTERQRERWGDSYSQEEYNELDGTGGAIVGLQYGLGEQWFMEGYLPTDKPDTIPEMIEKLNKKIFEEVSDEEFAKNVKEKQLLFGTSKSIASAVGNLIYNNPRTNNDSHNVIMNGITIPRDVAQGHSIMDIFSLIPLLGD